MQTLTRQVLSGTLMVVSLFLGHSILAQAADPLHGTWILDSARSKFNPGPAPQSITVTFAPAGDGVTVTANVTSADGKATQTSYTGHYDGKDNPITGAPSGAETVSL